MKVITAAVAVILAFVVMLTVALSVTHGPSHYSIGGLPAEGGPDPQHVEELIVMNSETVTVPHGTYLYDYYKKGGFEGLGEKYTPEEFYQAVMRLNRLSSNQLQEGATIVVPIKNSR